MRRRYTAQAFGLMLVVSCLAWGGGVVGVREAAAQTGEQRARLMRKAEVLQEQQMSERMAVETRAAQLRLPVRTLYDDGTVLELQRFVDGLPVFYVTSNLEEARAVSADRLWPGGDAGLALTGAGVTVGLWDGGAVRTDHVELAGRTSKGDQAYSVSGHATHVAGTIMAAGVDPAAQGMAGGAQLQFFDFSRDRAEMATAAAQGLRLSNHSYGQAFGWIANLRGDGRWGWLGNTAVSATVDYRFGSYDWMAAEWDDIAYHAPHYLMVKAAGNDRGQGPVPGEPHWVLDRELSQWVLSTEARERDGGPLGYASITDAGNAKNVLTVGAAASMSGPYTRPDDVQMTSFSGWGPTDDGRLKPDLVTDGVDVYSTSSAASTAYAPMTGTSSAAPVATGSVALLLELERTLRGANPYRSSTLKALLVHTADEAGAHPGPDYAFGWGLLNTYRAARVMQQSAQHDDFNIREAPLAQGGALAIPVYTDGSEPLRVTIAWIDPAGAPAPAAAGPQPPALVDDLDLRIVGPGGTYYLPWTLDPARPDAPAALADNVRDNVEQVLVAAPAPGWYTVQVTHKGLLDAGQQVVSVVVTGGGPEAPGVAVEARAFLQGPYASGAMTTALNAAGLLPTEHPYGDAPWQHRGAERVDPAFFQNHPDVVDWVLLELRTAPHADSTAAARAAFVTGDGRIVDLDGDGPVRFDALAPGAYYVVVHHRNHLAAMSPAPVDAADGTGVVDFTTGAAYGGSALAPLDDGAFGLPAGDADADGQVIAVDYQSHWRPQNGGPRGYFSADFDLDGVVMATDYQRCWRTNNGREATVPRR